MRLLFLLICLCFNPSVWALEINQATEAELDNLRGLGPAFTRRILAARAQQAFSNWSDLMRRVSGMGQATATKLSQQGLTVQGKPFSEEARSASPGLL